jgi:hypothetical protein
VDLAGTENCKAAEGDAGQMVEAGKINESLFNLGKCIAAMVKRQSQSKQDVNPLLFFFCR